MNQNEIDVMVHYDFTQQSIELNKQLNELANETIKIAQEGNAHKNDKNFISLTNRQEKLFIKQKEHFKQYEEFISKKIK